MTLEGGWQRIIVKRKKSISDKTSVMQPKAEKRVGQLLMAFAQLSTLSLFLQDGLAASDELQSSRLKWPFRHFFEFIRIWFAALLSIVQDMSAAEQSVTLSTDGKIAIITLNLPQKLNALTQDLYYRLACLMREVAARDDIYITVLTGKGRYFSAGADVSVSRPTDTGTDARRQLLSTFVAGNLEITNAFYTHPKILIIALNGPAIGLSAALIAFSDFIYCTPSAFLLTPFTSLGLVAEGGASYAFVQRLGISKANEALIMSKRITAEEMLATGFVNKIFPVRKGEEEKLLPEVMKEVKERLGDHLNSDSLIKVKEMIRMPDRARVDAMTVTEVLAVLERFASGKPQEEFMKIASGQKKHKL
ncbi:MAG: hypothetical protein Q9219_001524 [cf. Caloplaca sp. 3 TL-2023]